MIQCGDRTSFALESLGVLGLKALDGDDTIDSRVAGFPHFAHPARAERTGQLVGAKSNPGTHTLMVQPILAVAPSRPVEHSSNCEIESAPTRQVRHRTPVGQIGFPANEGRRSFEAPKFATWRSVLGRFRLEGNLDLDVTTSRRGSNGGGDPIDMPPNQRPLGATRQPTRAMRRALRSCWWRIRRSFVSSNSKPTSSAASNSAPLLSLPTL